MSNEIWARYCEACLVKYSQSCDKCAYDVTTGLPPTHYEENFGTSISNQLACAADALFSVFDMHRVKTEAKPAPAIESVERGLLVCSLCGTVVMDIVGCAADGCANCGHTESEVVTPGAMHHMQAEYEAAQRKHTRPTRQRC